ncbi:MAG: hypothetical protein ACKVVT_08430 [Dehalococcoidia bacterium]
MYKELGPGDHQRAIGISDDDVPDVLAFIGAFGATRTAARFARYLDDAGELPRMESWIGPKHGLKVALAAGMGGPLAAFLVHTWVGAGVPRVVQLGWYGALQPGTGLADVAVPHHAAREDGTSDWYLPKGLLADATPELQRRVAAGLRAEGVPVHESAIFTTPALLAESSDVISDWQRHGWQGVDMETATTFSVAKSLGAQRVAALIRMDDLVAETDSIASEWPKERRQALRAREELVFDVAMRAVAAQRGA